jgi:hypothetical protein
MGPKDIADALGKKNGAIRYLLSQMLQDGEVASPGYGKYTTTITTTTTTNTPNRPNTTNSPNTPNTSESVRNSGKVLGDSSGTPNTSERKTPANKQGVSGVSGVSGGVEEFPNDRLWRERQAKRAKNGEDEGVEV